MLDVAVDAEYDWTLGHCVRCGAFVRDGQGLQEVVKVKEIEQILRYCWKDWKIRCNGE